MTASSVLPGFAPVAVETGKALDLAIERLWLTGRVLPAGARLLVRHVFKSAEKHPIEVVYAFALPRDAALRRFRVNGEGFSVRSELKPVEEAVKLYERGLEEGHLATLARQYGDGLVNLTVGNVRPGETVTVNLEILAGVEAHDDGLRFRFPFTLAPCYHPRARAVAVEPGLGDIELPEEEFGDLMLPRFAADASGLHEVGFELEVCMDQAMTELASPSHSVRIARENERRARVALAPEKDVPDRDLVLEIRTAHAGAGALTGIDRQGKARFAVVVPSHCFGSTQEAPRRVVFVLDRSGSMDGPPLRQARKAVEACLGALSPRDSFGIVAFDDKTEVFRASLVRGTMENREQARAFLKGIGARGGTELARAVTAAAQIAGEGGDLLVLTDGQVFGTEAILEQARAVRVRLHCLGIGSASQDRFLALLARETGGVSRFLTARERVDVPAVDLFASIGRPLASEVRVSAAGMTLAPNPPQYVFAGTPLVLFGHGEAAGEGRLTIAWREGGPLEVPLRFSTSPIGESLRLIQGARLLTDAESHEGAGEQVEALSREFSLASRRMALVAVVERAGDRPGEIPITRVVRVGMPQDTPFPAYFGATLMAARAPAAASGMLSRVRAALRVAEAEASFQSPAAGYVPPPVAAAEDREADLLLDVAAHIEADGGMPGANDEDRVVESAFALLELAAGGNTVARGPFRRHVRRLIEFLEKAAAPLPPERAEVLERLLELARQGRPLPGGWGHVSRARFWSELEQALS